MVSLARLGGLLADAALGLPVTATPYTVERDVAVPMPDGVTPAGDHYRPAGDEGPLPVVLIRTPYGREGVRGLLFAAPLARRGFQVFVQSTRGTFGSGGQFRPFTTEQEDGLATVAWLRDQPWCDGRVAMTGGSYFGHTQWAVAPYADPPLVSVSPHVTAARSSAAFYDHGAPQVQNALTLVGADRPPGARRAAPAPLPTRGAAGPHRARTAPAAAAGRRRGRRRRTGAVLAGLHRARRPRATRSGRRADHDQAELTRFPPVNMVTGWWDLFLPAQLTDYAALRAAGVPARLTVGPWLHGEPGELRAIVRSDVAWLDHHLRGGPAPRGSRCGSSCSRPAPGWSSTSGRRRRPAGRAATCAPAAA